MEQIINKKRKLKVALCVMAYLDMSNKRQKRKWWVKTWMKNRNTYGHMPLLQELRNNFPSDFRNYLRMDAESFRILLDLVSPIISKQDTRMRESISAEERLTTTLRYLATGRSFEDLKFSTGISSPSLCKIIPETCKAIYEVFKKTDLKFPSTKQDWLEIAAGFKKKWQFINCGGQWMANIYAFIVLMALVNSSYEFIFVDVGKNGRLSDGGVIECTEFYHKLINDQLNIPDNTETDNNLNFVFLGDEAFALNEHFLKPYPQRDLSYSKRIFNYRLSRARNVSENAFGLIAARFRILHTPIHMIYPENISYVVLAICALHNFLRKRDTSYISSTSFDQENNVTHEVQMGDWRKNMTNLTNLQNCKKNVSTIAAKTNRENYTHYFNSDGKVSWQDEMLNKGKA